MKTPLALAFGLLLVATTPADAQQSTDPDFNMVTDILGGQWQLIRVDDITLGYWGSDVLRPFAGSAVLQTSNSSVSNSFAFLAPALEEGVAAGPGIPNVETLAVRMYNMPNDVVITAYPVNSPTMAGLLTPALYVNNVAPGIAVGSDAFGSLVPTQIGGGVNGAASADFNQDGFSEVVLHYGGGSGPSTASGGMIIAAAGLPSAASVAAGGLRFGPETTTASAYGAIATGDFNGDATPDIAGAAITGSNSDVSLVFHTVDPQTLTIASGQMALLQVSGALAVTLTAGDFDGDASSELLLVAALASSTQVFAIDVTGTFTPTVSDSKSLGAPLPGSLQSASGRINWFGGGPDQAVFAYYGGGACCVSLVLFESNLAMDIRPVPLEAVPSPDILVPTDVGFGNFDQSNDPNLEIAVVELQEPIGSVGSAHVTIIDVDVDSNYAMSVTSQVEYDFEPPGTATSLAAGDTQGRSLLVGPPTKVVINNHSQPEIVLGMPPMHVDWVPPVGESDPEVLNVSAVPDGFSSSYQTRATMQNQSSRMSTTSHTNSFEETLGVKNSFGVPGIGSVSVDVNQMFNQTYENTTAMTYNTYSSVQFDASTSTGFSDHIWFTTNRFNIYLYPVIGHTACPEMMPNCAPADMHPLWWQVSGPDMVTPVEIDAATVEWYQPIHEPGNVLSYPWSEALLKAPFPNLVALTQDPPTSWFTDGSTQTQQSNWSAGMGMNQSTGSTRSFNYDTSVSVSSKVDVLGDDAELNVGFDYNRSCSTSTLNTSSEMVGSSTGVGIAKPGTFLDPNNYQYAVQTLVFGEGNPAGVVQQIPLNTDLQSTGVLRTGFIADPTDPQAGGWWTRTYTLPDVALNHPARWLVRPDTAPKPPANCLRFSPRGGTLDCVTFNAPCDPTAVPPCDLPLAQFYWMRGFLITPADAPGEGPLNTTATAGDVLSLQARVYNYSLTDMPMGTPDMPMDTQVHVRFYGQEWDESQFTFMGDAFLIDEVIVSPIPAFNSNLNQGTLPNWTLASTMFDTANYPDISDTYLVFWVVVWMEDAAGALVAEMPGHGLTAIPGTLTSLADAPVEAYSNNVGFFNQPIFIEAQGSLPATQGAPPGMPMVQSVVVSPAVAQPGQRLEVRAEVGSTGAPLHGTTLVFGDESGGRFKAFDSEHVPWVRSGDTYIARVPVRLDTCGEHTISVAAAGAGGQPQATARVQVICSPTPTPTVPPAPEDDGCQVARPSAGDLPSALLLLVGVALLARWQARRRGHSDRPRRGDWFRTPG